MARKSLFEQTCFGTHPRGCTGVPVEVQDGEKVRGQQKKSSSFTPEIRFV